MLGLDAAGKTSECPPLRVCARAAVLTARVLSQAILYKLKLNQSVTTIPTGACLVFMRLLVLFLRCKTCFLTCNFAALRSWV